MLIKLECEYIVFSNRCHSGLWGNDFSTSNSLTSIPCLYSTGARTAVSIFKVSIISLMLSLHLSITSNFTANAKIINLKSWNKVAVSAGARCEHHVNFISSLAIVHIRELTEITAFVTRVSAQVSSVQVVPGHTGDFVARGVCKRVESSFVSFRTLSSSSSKAFGACFMALNAGPGCSISIVAVRADIVAGVVEVIVPFNALLAVEVCIVFTKCTYSIQ